MSRLTWIVLVAATASFAAAAQQPPAPADPALRFEVASVKPSDPSSLGMRIAITPVQASLSAVPLRRVLRLAYQIQDDQIGEVPDWVNTARFDIVAKPSDGAAVDGIPMMIRNLLADRFRMVAHTETRDVPAYALVLARSDRRLGPTLTVSTPECQAQVAGLEADLRAGRPPTRPATPPDLASRPPCGFARTGTGVSLGSGQRIGMLVTTLANFAGRAVIDRTGLSEYYDYELKWTPDPGQSGPGGPVPGGTPPPPSDPDAPELFTALQEQLGLRLESQRTPVSMLVVDRIERPTSD